MNREHISEFLRFRPSTANPSYEILGVEEVDGYFRKLIKYTSSFNAEIRAYLLEPKSNPIGWGVLVYHQHSSQWHIGKSEPAGLCGDPYNQFGPALASMGVTVICPDCIGFENRRRVGVGTVENEHTDWQQYYNGMAYRLVMGDYLITEILEDYNLALNILLNHAFVDENNVGAIGHSFGGNTILFHAAVDERLNFACASGSACTVKTKMAQETGLEMSLLIPGFFKEYDMHHLVECVVPRKLLLLSGTEDPYSYDAGEIYKKARHKWIQAGVPENFKHISFNGGHGLDKERFEAIVNWVACNLDIKKKE
ncbi:MAG: hypothetical protein FP816_04140 [Desulfobacteraceae bacterium]|nr:hypothetical protein [Desulfobacteraceae bacterium]MBU3947816.1 acetylxylan esterase [Pseudomonadota bacterium]MBU4053040.1 acetylxylan esterase [Pseudomonadota bacterium]